MRLSEITGIQPSNRTFKGSDLLVDPHCVIGIEIEAEGVTSTANSKVDTEFWDSKEDHSLRDGGREFASKPLFGEDIIIALANVDAALSSSRGAVITYRCGLHIHIDVSGLNTEQLLSFTCAYLVAESTLFKYVGDHRRNNIYCLPLTVTEELAMWYKSLKRGTSALIYESISKTHKYNAFNILPILTQGSVEFRHHPGTWNKDRILNWINIIQHLRHVGMNIDACSLLNMPYYRIADVVFGRFKDELCPTGEIDLDGWVMAKDFMNMDDIDKAASRIMSPYRDFSVINYKGAA